jgi:hypothetical protein
MTSLLLVAIFAISLPVWKSVISHSRLSPDYKQSVLAFTIGSIVQAGFVIEVGDSLIPLAMSSNFVVPGAICYILAIVFWSRDPARAYQPYEILPCSFLGLAGWFFLCTLH